MDMTTQIVTIQVTYVEVIIEITKMPVLVNKLVTKFFIKENAITERTGVMVTRNMVKTTTLMVTINTTKPTQFGDMTNKKTNTIIRKNLHSLIPTITFNGNGTVSLTQSMTTLLTLFQNSNSINMLLTTTIMIGIGVTGTG